MGVGPPGRSGRDQLVALRGDFPTQPVAADGLPIIAVCCAQAPASHVAALRARGARIHTASCLGNLHSSVVELYVRQGAPGVIICGCPPRDCVGREGPKWLQERLYHDREAELQPRVDRRRVSLATLAPGDLAGTLAAFDAFARAVAELGLPEPDVDLSIEALCDPVPVEEGVP
jgi:coenzyme F420-reducing hydrogenase delta subunit